MIVVSDTSPLNYLVLIEVVEVLPALFGRDLWPAPRTPASFLLRRGRCMLGAEPGAKNALDQEGRWR